MGIQVFSHSIIRIFISFLQQYQVRYILYLMENSLTLSMPAWFEEFFHSAQKDFSTLEGKMRFVLELGRQNILNKTGGPFSSAIFNMETGELVSCGVNRVMAQSCSAAHGEMMALMLGQKKLKTYDFSLKGRFQMLTSAKMCIMCLGNVIWSGIKEVVASGRPSDVESITGFDEGPTPKQYNKALQERGINVIEDVLREEGIDMLKLYVSTGGFIYNSQANKEANTKNHKEAKQTLITSVSE